MALLGNFRALAIRRVATASANGLRKIGQPSPEDLLSAGMTGLARFADWAIATFIGPFLQWSATSIWSLIVSSGQAIMQFNWNATDEDIEKAFEGFQERWYEQFGEVVGTMLGWTVGGLVPGLILFRFNSAMALYVLDQVGEEAYEELSAELTALCTMTVQNYLAEQGMRLFMGIRALIKRAAYGESDTLAGDGVMAFFDNNPGLRERAKKWGEKGAKPWIISKNIEDWIEKIDDKLLKKWLEGLWDSFGDSFIEAGFVVAGGIDAWIGQQRMERRNLLGPERVVELIYNRKDRTEKVVFAGAEEVIKPQIVGHMANWKLMKEKDLGLLVGGEPVANHITTPGKPWARIVFSNSDTKKTKPTYIDLHNIKRSKWDDWEQIKLACGGKNGYQWGPYRVKALLPDNTEIFCYAGSEDEGVDLIERFLPFVEAGDDLTAIQWHCGHEMKKGTRLKYESTYKRPRKQIPWEFTIVNPTRVLNEENGKANRSGIYSNREAFIALHTETKPDDFEETINELFRTPGPNP